MNKKFFIKTRFAPSPTGMLHVGGARTALFNYLFAKKFENGKFVLRVEDTDIKRSSDFYAEKQYEDLCWLGLAPDLSPFDNNFAESYKQSLRTDIYKRKVSFLLEKKRAYFCFCSDSDIRKERTNYYSASGRKNYKYSRKCFHLGQEEVDRKILNNEPFSIRFFVDNNKSYDFEDGVRGKVSFLGSDIEDFIIFRNDNTPLLNFAVVVDDHEMGITHIIRAEEHLTNTAKQIALYEGLEWNPPFFFHISIIINSERKKISKRDKSSSSHLIVDNLRSLGYLPQAVINYLFFLGFNPVKEGDNEIFSLEKIIEYFDKDRFNSRPSVFSIEKLNWFNNQWIRKTSNEEFDALAEGFLKNHRGNSHIAEMARVFKDQINCLSELSVLVEIFFPKENFELETRSEIRSLIENFYKRISTVKVWSKDFIAEEIKNCIKSLEKNNRKDFFLGIRTLLTGKNHGPEISTLIYFIGKKETERRILNFIRNG